MIKNEQKDYAGNLEMELQELHQLEEMNNEIDSRGTITYSCTYFLTIVCC